MKQYVEEMINKINSLEFEKQKEIERIKTTSELPTISFVGVDVPLSNEQKKSMEQIFAEAINQIIRETDEAIELLNQTILNHFEQERKTINQDMTALEPVPTDEQEKITGQIVREYHNLQNESKFFSDLQFHIENETVKALPYYFACKELFPEAASNHEILKKIVPAIVEKEAALKELEEVERIYKSFYINHKLQTNPEMQTLDKIRLKQELADVENGMKAYEVSPNQPRITEIIARLNTPGVPITEAISLKQELALLGGMNQLSQKLLTYV